MHLVEHLGGETLIHRLDPRLKVLVALAFTVVLAASHRWPSLAFGLALGFSFLWLARLDWSAVLFRLAEVNLFMLLIVIVLPFSSPGQPIFQAGPFVYTKEGLLFSLAIAAKGNAIVFFLIVFLSTIEAVALGHALARLRLPAKLIHLFLFTIRYVDVLHHEYLRLRAAMKCRGFKPALNWHTCRSLGYLAAILLVRALDRSERIQAAMKCRGFRGRFNLLAEPKLAGQDLWFGLLAACLAAALVGLEWL